MRERHRFDLRQLALSLTVVAVLLVLATLCCGQEPPPVPAYPQPQSQQVQAWLVPMEPRFPWLRYEVLGLRPRLQLMVPVGQPFQATVQPVAPYRGRWR